MEDFVTYEQAISLKKLGFDLKVNHYYDDEGYIIENLVDYSEEVPHGEYTSYDNFNYEDVCSAPTLAQAQKWLREKGYSIETMLCVDKTYRCDIFRIEDFKHISFKIIDIPSYEKALSEGITECINILLNK